MDRRRAAGLLLALAAWFATATAAPTASNHTALDLYDGAPDGCYYNFQHYGEGDRIMTNEPCLNCTCHNRMLMCYLRVCPFTKPIGQDCTIEKRADQCCPIVTCPDVPVDLLTSTTTSPAEYGPTGMGKLDKFGCSINGKYFSEGSKVPPTPNKPCEHCYCIRNMTTCVMQECTLHVDGCTPIYHKDVCCPVRYSCDHPEDEMPLLDDLSTTVRPTPGFILTTTTISPVTQMSQDCVYDNKVFPDGALIKTEKACDHCYCMKGDIVCVVQECGTPMENEGKNCTALPPREGVCCPDTYICEGDESTTETSEIYDITTQAAREEFTTLSEPKRTSSEGSGYRNEPDEVIYTEMPAVFEPEIEGSGEEEEPKQPSEIMPSPTPEPTDDILASTEETHEYIPLTTVKSTQDETPEVTTAGTDKEDDSISMSGDREEPSESSSTMPITTSAITKEDKETVTDKTQVQSIDSSEVSEDENVKPDEVVAVTSSLPDMAESAPTETNDQAIVTGVTDQDSFELLVPVTRVPLKEEEKTNEPIDQDTEEKTTPQSPIDNVITNAPGLEEDTSTGFTESSKIDKEEENATKSPEISTTSISTIDSKVKETTEFAEQTSSVPESQHYPSSTRAPGSEDEFVTTDSIENEQVTENAKETVYIEPQTHSTESTPMLEEIEKDTTEYSKTEHLVTTGTIQEDTSYIFSTTVSNIPSVEKDVPEVTSSEVHNTEDYTAVTTDVPSYNQQETTSPNKEDSPAISVDTSFEDSSKLEPYLPSTVTTIVDESGRRTTQADIAITTTKDKLHEADSTTSLLESETERATTEPDKGLNTIPSDLLEEGGPVSPKAETATVAQETTMGTEFTPTRVTDSADFTTVSSKQTTVSSDTSVFRDEASTLTPEPFFRKEDDSQTESHISPESTTMAAGAIEEVTSTLAHDYTKITGSTLDVQQEIATTLKPKYTENIEETTSAKESTIASSIEYSTPEISVSEKDLGPEEETVTTTSSLEKLPETTTANQEDNEIFNEPRIPGEGDCLLNGVTYMNESVVPSSNKCHTGCKCISSIIKCDPIICSPPPEYMDNCETIYDTTDACCPTYICDHKTETIPPQSQSQMSGTEAPVVSPVHCHGDECEISEDKQQTSGSPIDACKSGNCPGQSDESQVAGLEEPITDKKEECVGEICSPSLCTDKNGCPATPVKSCDGEKCEIAPDTLPQEPQLCANGEDCKIDNIPTKECSGENCVTITDTLPQEPQPCANGEDCKIDTIPTKECSGENCVTTSDTHSQVIPPKEICSEEDGCQNAPTVNEECKEDSCRKKDTSTVDKPISEPCQEPECKQTETNVEISTTSILPQTSQDVLSEDDKKETAVKETETTEKLDTTTESYDYSRVTSEFTEPHEVITKQPELIPNDSMTTVSDSMELVTKLDYVPEPTTKLSDTTYQQQTTGDEFVTEKKQLDTTDEPEYLLPVVTESTTKVQDTKVPSLVETASDISQEPDTTEDSINIDDHITETDRPQDSDIMETLKPQTEIFEETTAKTSVVGSTEPSKVYTSEAQEVTETLENLEPVDATSVISEGPTEATVTQTTESHDTTKSSGDIEHHDITQEVAEGSGTEPTKIDTEINKITYSPEVIISETTTQSVQEITEPPKTYVTESQEITESHNAVNQDDITDRNIEVIITESSKASEESVTEPTKMYSSDEQTKQEDHVETSSMPLADLNTESPALSTDSQKVTIEIVEKESSTTEDISSEPPKSISNETQEVTESSEDTEHRSTPSIISQETGTEPTKTYDTESQDMTKSSQEFENEVTTPKTVVEQGTELSPETYESTKSPQNIDQEGSKSTDESEGTVPSTESSQTLVTETRYPEEVSDEDNVSKEPTTGTHETNTPEKQGTEPQEVIKSDDENDQITTIKTLEESFTELPETIVTDQQTVSLSSEDTSQTDTTSKILETPMTEPPATYVTEQEKEQLEVTKSSEELGTTLKNIEDSVTATPETLDVEAQETPKLTEETASTSKISQESATEPPKAYTTEAQESESSEEKEFVGTTIRTIDQTTAPAVISEAPKQHETESDGETQTIKPTITDMSTEVSKIDNESSNASESPDAASSLELLTSESAETTTALFVTDSKSTTPQATQTMETASEIPYVPESHHTQSDLDGLTEPSVKEQESTTSSSTSDSEQKPTESILEKDEPEKPDIETQTSSGLDGVSKPDSQEVLTTQQSELPTVDENTIPEHTDTEIQVPVYIPKDELSTTSSETQDLATMKPIDTSKTPYDMEIKTEYPEKDEYSTEDLLIVSQHSTEESSIGTEKPAFSEEDKQSEKTKDTVPVTPEISMELRPTQEENYTDEPVNRYSSPQTVSYDTTKSYIEEDIRTEEPMLHETKEPVKPIDDLIQSLVTEQYEISTKSSDLEKTSETETPIQISSASSSSESDITEQINAIERITTPPTKDIGTTINESDIKSESTTHEKPVDTEIHTETPVFDTTNESTTQKQQLPEEDQTLPEAPEKDTISELTTQYPDTASSIPVATDIVTPFMPVTEIQEYDATDKPSVNIQDISTESLPATEVVEIKEPSAVAQPTSISDQEQTKSEQEVTKSPEIQTQEQTEPSETVSAETPETSSGTEGPMSEPVNVDYDTTLTDLITTKAPAPSKEQTIVTTLEPSVENEIASELEPTATSKYEYPEKITTLSETAETTDKINEESKITPASEELATENVRLTEATIKPEVFTETQPDTILNVTSEKEAPEIEVLLTTKQPIETEIHETTSPSVEDISEKSTYSPTKSEEESTSVQDISPVEPIIPDEEQSKPVDISDLEKISTAAESTEAQTERFTPASEKPSQETTVPEEEFLLVPRTTTVKAEKEITTDKPAEEPATIVSEEAITTVPEVKVTTAPEVPVTKIPEVPDTTLSEIFVTTASEVPFTSVPEAPISTASEAPAITVPEMPVTTSPEAPVTRAPEAPITAAPEVSSTTAPEAPATAPELPKPVSTEVQPTDEVPTPDDEGSFPPSGGTSGYGPDTDYVEEDQTFGPGTCRYGGKVYVSAQQIPRDDPCDFCFCFRSDIICLQQSCPPPIHGCHEEPIQGFCCPRYECPVSMATTVNVTTTTTTTTTTLPPNFPTHSYKGSAQRRGCQIKGQTYKVGDVVRASSGPCLHCTCGGDGQMKCDPKVCTPEPMLRQMIAAAVSAKRRR